MLNNFKLWADMARIGWESQMVIGLRTAGMFGILPASRGEAGRMIAEKQEAAMASVRAATRAAMKGKRADQILSAAMQPYGRRTHANARRLTRMAMW